MLDIVLICHPALDKTESRTEEEKADSNDAVEVEEEHSSGFNELVLEDNEDMVEYDEHCKEALYLFDRYTVEKFFAVLRSSRYTRTKEYYQKRYADIKSNSQIHYFSTPFLS